jgi:hypothetical protein
MSNYYNSEKGKTRTNIYVAGTGEFVCQLLNREVKSWLFRAEEAKIEEANTAFEVYEARLCAVSAYLKVRAARKAETDRQGSMF